MLTGPPLLGTCVWNLHRELCNHRRVTGCRWRVHDGHEYSCKMHASQPWCNMVQQQKTKLSKISSHLGLRFGSSESPKGLALQLARVALVLAGHGQFRKNGVGVATRPPLRRPFNMAHMLLWFPWYLLAPPCILAQAACPPGARLRVAMAGTLVWHWAALALVAGPGRRLARMVRQRPHRALQTTHQAQPLSATASGNSRQGGLCLQRGARKTHSLT